jgi:hypothetical protein
MQNLIKLLLLLTLLTSSAIAQSDPVYLEKDAKSPYTGLLFTVEESQALRKELIEKDTLVKINESLTRSLDLYRSNESLYQSQKNILLEQNDKLAKSLYSERQLSSTEKALYFLGGVALTGLAVYAASQLVNR